MKKISFFLPLILLLASCASRSGDQADTIVSMQIVDRNGFSETISSKDRIAPYREVDFFRPQPYQKVLRVFSRNMEGQSISKITSYHSNGQVWQYLEVVDGRANGLYQEWFSNGQLKIEAHVIEGLADLHDVAQTSWIFDGPSHVFDEDGNRVAEIFYVKGFLHSPTRYYYASGQLQKEIPYEMGMIEGAVCTYDTSGSLIEEILYRQDLKHGTAHASWQPHQPLFTEEYQQNRLLNATYYNSDGIQVAEIKDGSGTQAEFKEGVLYSITEFKEGIPEGSMKIFYPEGGLKTCSALIGGKKNGEEWEYFPPKKDNKLRPKLCVHWHDGHIQGQVKTWYEDGALESQREINNGKKQGLCFAWYKNGDLMLVEEYENDLLLKGSYYKKGDRAHASKIEAGKGIATLHTSDGLLLRKINYEKGKPLLEDEVLR